MVQEGCGCWQRSRHVRAASFFSIFHASGCSCLKPTLDPIPLALTSHFLSSYQYGVLLWQAEEAEQVDETEAAKWWLKAAGMGYKPAQIDVAYAYVLSCGSGH